MRRAPVILALLFSLAGCDGYLVSLNIKEQTAAHEKAHDRTLYGCNQPNILELVKAVADSLNLIEQSPSTRAASQNKLSWRSSDGRFMLMLESRNEGLWRVDLLDWPNFPQSALSKQAEVRIRQAVKASCSSS